MQSSWFKNSRFKGGKGKGVGGAGLGFKERPALGYDGPANSSDNTPLSEQYKYDKKHKEGLAKPGNFIFIKYSQNLVILTWKVFFLAT